MNPAPALSLTAAVACACLGARYLHTYRMARRAMDSHLQPAGAPAPPALRRLERWFAGTACGRVCAGYLARCGLTMSPLQYAGVVSAAGAGAYLFVTGFLELAGIAAVSAVLGLLAWGTHMYLQQRRQQFLRQLQLQLPEVAHTISNALRAGHSLHQALVFVAGQARRPARDVLSRCREELALGRAPDDVCHDLIARYDSPDLRLLFGTIILQRQTGGNLIAALDSIAHTIRRREETLGDVRATLSQAQQTVRILPFLPFICGLMFNMALPGFLAPLFTPAGLVVLGVVVVLLLLATAIIRRTVRIEV